MCIITDQYSNNSVNSRCIYHRLVFKTLFIMCFFSKCQRKKKSNAYE